MSDAGPMWRLILSATPAAFQKGSPARIRSGGERSRAVDACTSSGSCKKLQRAAVNIWKGQAAPAKEEVAPTECTCMHILCVTWCTAPTAGYSAEMSHACNTPPSGNIRAIPNAVYPAHHTAGVRPCMKACRRASS